MKAILSREPVTPSVKETDARSVAAEPRPHLSGMTRAIREAYLQVVGIPDYERYAEHMASHHPGAPLLSRREFFAQAIDRKYGSKGPRCC